MYPIDGDKPYQVSARRAFPILVRQTYFHQTISYSDLAKEIEMENPRNLNYVLGSIGDTIAMIGSELGIGVPPIAAIVVGKNDGLPGEGIEEYLPERYSLKELSAFDRRKVIDKALTEVYSFDQWREILHILKLTENTIDSKEIGKLLVQNRKLGQLGSGGEGPEHKAFKQYCFDNPKLFMNKVPGHKYQEYSFESADTVDVAFETDDSFVAVEVKSRISDDSDLLRGIFQVVKYRALADAHFLVIGQKKAIDIFLATETQMPAYLDRVRLGLGVAVVHLPRT